VRHELPPVDLMVMAREQAAGVPGPELLRELAGVWKKLLASRAGTIEPLKRTGDTTTIQS
jgi:ribonuclease P protein component